MWLSTDWLSGPKSKADLGGVTSKRMVVPHCGAILLEDFCQQVDVKDRRM